MGIDLHQKLRESYKPERIKLLYIAESPPAGGTFFYSHDSNLYEALHTVFANVYDKECGDGTAFLSFFKSKGCYLEDLCLEPVNTICDREREEARQAGVEQLAQRIGKAQPIAIVILMNAIEKYVSRAISLAKGKPKYRFVTPFPAHSASNRKNCIDKNTNILNLLENENLI